MIIEGTRQLGPFLIYEFRDQLARRSIQLVVGLALFGFAISLAIKAAFGTNAWTVFHVGLGDKLGMSTGTMVILTGVAILLFYIPLKEPIGVGTVLNALLIGPALDISNALIPDPSSTGVRLFLIFISPIVLGLASGLYIGAGMGPGPRDGVMTALERRGYKIWQARTAIELSALGAGALLGGPVGFGTIWMAVSIGWWVQLFLPPLRIDEVVSKP